MNRENDSYTTRTKGFSSDDERRAYQVVGDLLASIPKPLPSCIHALRDGKSYVYFIGGDDTPIKIGFSMAPFERLAALQTGHWMPLSILAKAEGTLRTEGLYHRLFAKHRMAGEWFTRHDDILAEIAHLNQVAECVV